MKNEGISRKKLLKTAIAAVPVPLLMGAGVALGRESQELLEPTPYCEDPDDPTPAQMEGPYFKPNSPRRTSIVDGTGTRLVLTGYVFDRACRPVANALLDFWQADNAGTYDNRTYRFRGHQFTNAQGGYSLSTIVPGLYPGRTRHIHVKVQAPGKPILTTQLYFQNEPRNNTDSLFDPRLLITGQSTFDFVLNLVQTPPSGSPSPTPTGGGATTWRAGVAYRVGDLVTYAGIGYRCQIAHTSMVGWEPPNTPALWSRT